MNITFVKVVCHLMINVLQILVRHVFSVQTQPTMSKVLGRDITTVLSLLDSIKVLLGIASDYQR